jgi:hypothetical protein
MNDKTTMDLLPYGRYEFDGGYALFDRRYQPIVIYKNGKYKPCAPTEWINYKNQYWFYNDSTSPRINADTLLQLEEMLEANHVLRAEFERRIEAAKWVKR